MRFFHNFMTSILTGIQENKKSIGGFHTFSERSMKTKNLSKSGLGRPSDPGDLVNTRIYTHHLSAAALAYIRLSFLC